MAAKPAVRSHTRPSVPRSSTNSSDTAKALNSNDLPPGGINVSIRSWLGSAHNCLASLPASQHLCNLIRELPRRWDAVTLFPRHNGIPRALDASIPAPAFLGRYQLVACGEAADGSLAFGFRLGQIELNRVLSTPETSASDFCRLHQPCFCPNAKVLSVRCRRIRSPGSVAAATRSAAGRRCGRRRRPRPGRNGLRGSPSGSGV